MRRVFDLIEDANLTSWNYASLVSVKDAAERWAQAGMVPTTSITMLAEVLERLVRQEHALDEARVGIEDHVERSRHEDADQANHEAIHGCRVAMMSMPASNVYEAMIQLWLVADQVQWIDTLDLTKSNIEKEAREMNRAMKSIQRVLSRDLGVTLPSRFDERFHSAHLWPFFEGETAKPGADTTIVRASDNATARVTS